ncbi:MAG TPA: hypothetical protein VGD65_06630 [Chryseosolibacter sp.]
MDLKEVWKNLEREKLNKPVAGTIEIPKHSKHPVSKLIQTFAAGLIFCIAFELVFVYLFFVMDQTIVKVGMVVIIFIYTFLFAINFKALSRLRQLYHSDENVMRVLQDVREIVTRTINFQQKISWGFFPLCVAAGFVLGISIKKDAATLIVQPLFYGTLLVTMAIVTPACYFLTRWMIKLSYGKYLTQIEDLIQQGKAE